MASKLVVYADVREDKSGIPSLLESMGIIVYRKQLSMGDYLISDEVVIERKTAYDFAHSIFDGRLFDQAKRLAENYPVVVYIIEGDPTRLRRYQRREKQITAALVTLAIDYSVKIIYSRGPEHTAEIIASIVKRVNASRGRRVVIHKKPKLETTRDWQLYILQSFPGIGPKTAEKILEAFGSLEDFINASKAEISRIPGIGEKKAETIRKIIMARYRSSTKGREPRSTTLEEFVAGEE